MNGNQTGDPVKLTKALIAITNMQEPLARWVAGSDSLEDAEGKVKALQKQINAHRDMSTSLAYEDVQAGVMS